MTPAKRFSSCFLWNAMKMNFILQKPDRCSGQGRGPVSDFRTGRGRCEKSYSEAWKCHDRPPSNQRRAVQQLGKEFSDIDDHCDFMSAVEKILELFKHDMFSSRWTRFFALIVFNINILIHIVLDVLRCVAGIPLSLLCMSRPPKR